MKRILLSLWVLIISCCVTVQAERALQDAGIYKVVIMGSGPAGGTAAIYMARSYFPPLVIEGPECGGVLMNAGPIENWPGVSMFPGPELMASIKKQAQFYGAEYIADTVVKVDLQHKPFTLWMQSGREIKTHALIVATGFIPQTLGCAGETKYWGKGVSVCVLCDGPLFTDKDIIVVGAGDLGLDKALYLTRFARHVTIMYRGNTMTASAYMQQKVLNNPKITLMPNSTLTEIYGNDAFVTGVKLKNTKTGVISDMATEGVFMSIGFTPCASLFDGQLELNGDGYISIKAQLTPNGNLVPNTFTRTSVDGVFVAGVVGGHGYRPAITAAGGGCMAAGDAEAYLTDMFSEARSFRNHEYCPHKVRH